MIWILSRTFRILVAASALVFISDAGAVKCSDLFNSVGSRLASEAAFNADFGAGIYLRKVSPKEFRLEPPPMMFTTARSTQRHLAHVARKADDKNFTVLFTDFTEPEVHAFKAMLQRDARIEGDERLTAVLLSHDSKDAATPAEYTNIRQRALQVRDMMLRRYNWTSATVSQETVSKAAKSESYRLTVSKTEGLELFLLQLRLRGTQYVRDRTASITSTLGASGLINATPEQLAHSVIQKLKETDKGISNGSLKVMAADFVIAEAYIKSGE